MTDEQFNEIIGELRTIHAKINFLESDINELRDVYIENILAGLKTIVSASLQSVQAQEAKSYKVERL